MNDDFFILKEASLDTFVDEKSKKIKFYTEETMVEKAAIKDMLTGKVLHNRTEELFYFQTLFNNFDLFSYTFKGIS